MTTNIQEIEQVHCESILLIYMWFDEYIYPEMYLTEDIYPSICNAPFLEVLNMSNNSLSGMMPQCLSTMTRTLVVLNLRTNNLTGSIANAFPRWGSLKTLDLNGNQIEGQFPESLTNCRSLEVVNLGNNQITGTFPHLLSKMAILRVLILRSNKLYGRIGCPKAYDTWPMLQIIDISHNNFSGPVPRRCVRTWRAMMADDSLSELKHLQFQVLKLSEVYYEDAITVTTKGVKC